MTIKFFPVFWIQEVALSPVMVQFMSALVPLLLALSSYAMHPLAMVIGEGFSALAPAHCCVLSAHFKANSLHVFSCLLSK